MDKANEANKTKKADKANNANKANMHSRTPWSACSKFRFQTRPKLVSLHQHFDLYVFPRGWDDDLLSALAKLVFYRAMLHAPVIAVFDCRFARVFIVIQVFG